MTNENETVEQICKDMTFFCYRGSVEECQISEDGLLEYADRILAAHKREVESLRWKVENYAQIVAAKDAEIEDLMKRIAVYEEVVTENGGRFLKQDAEIAKRGAIIKELADALDVALENLSEECWTHCSLAEECANSRAEEGTNSCIVVDSMKGLLAKAREVVK